MLSHAIWRALFIEFRQDNYQRLLCKLQGIADGKWPQAIRGTRVLRLRSLSLRFDAPMNRNGRIPDERRWRVSDVPQPSIRLEIKVRIGRLLPAVISQLIGVQTVECVIRSVSCYSSLTVFRWKPCESDTSDLLGLTAEAITALPGVRHFRMDTTFYTPAPQGRRLRILASYSRDEQPPMDHLSKCISKNPRLSSLSLVRECHWEPTATTSLHNIFAHSDTVEDPPKLTALTLHGFNVQLDDTILRHFRHLRSLTIFRFVDGPKDDPDSGNGGTGMAKYFGSYPDLWHALRNAGIELACIRVSHMSKAFVGYISSYSGLEDLDIGLNPDRSLDFGATAEEFWDALGRNHGAMLKHVDLDPSWYGGEWCFSREQVPGLLQCKQLQTLKIGVATNTDSPGLTSTIDSSGLNIVCHFPDP